jgi:hypothetical protein
MNVLTSRHPRAGTMPRATSLAERFIAAVPLASIYLWLCIVYGVEAWKRATPWLFTDELEMTQISRAYAATGQPARRGAPYAFHSLYPVLTAPVWWIQNVATAYDALKYLDVIVMASVLFPTYFLARLVVRRVPALFAAAGAATIPALAYSSWIVEETFAYPYTALCFLLIAKALIVRSRGWIAAATAASLLAPGVREELIVIPIVALLATVFAIWSSDAARARRSTWSTGDWLGFFTLVAGLLIFISAVGSQYSSVWYGMTQYYKHRMLTLGGWAAGAFTIGVGVVPLVGGLSALVPARGEKPSRAVRMFRCVAVAGLIVFGLYTAMKGAYLSTVFATRIVERNLIYIAPLLFIGTAFVLERRRVHPVALAAAGALAFYLVVGTPLSMNVQLYSDALGFAILEQANRYFEWTPATAQWLLIAVLLVGVALLYALGRVGLRTGTAVAALLAVGMLTWNVTSEIAAGAGTVSLSRDITPTLGRPFTWVDDVTKGKPTIYLAQGVADQDPEWLLEFWNRSITTVDSLDGTLQGPGPTGAPNITSTGQLFATHDPAHPGPLHAYGVEDWPCVDFEGKLRATHFYRGGADHPKEWRLIELTKPNRLRAECVGLYADGWSGARDSEYFRFAGAKPGWVRIGISRQNYPATPVDIQLTKIAEQEFSPVLGRVIKQIRFTLQPSKDRVQWLRVPAGGFAVRVVIVRKFVPRELDARSNDPRTLGALVDYRFVTDAAHKKVKR